MASKNVVTVDSSNFDQEVLGADVPVLVDFWAAWCGPCRMVAPLLDQIADEMGEKVRIAKLNVDENQELAMQYGVRSIPTFILFKGGDVAESKVGALPKSAFQDLLERHA